MRIEWSKAMFAVLLSAMIGTQVVGSELPRRVTISPDVYQFLSPDIHGVEVDGNSIAIVGAADVLVFDTNVLPSSARRVLSALQQITHKPVRYVVNSHWHPDHWDGNEIYAKQFPNLEIIASGETRALMESTAKVYRKTIEFEAQQINAEIDYRLKNGKTSGGRLLTEKDRSEIAKIQGVRLEFMTEYSALKPVLPTLTFDNDLTLFHGARELQLHHLPGNTAGDTVLFIPDEKILIAGDLLVYPIPFTASSHPSAWIKSLEVMAKMNATTIIPGHGEAQHGNAYLNLVLQSLLSVQDRVHDALRRGLTLAETENSVNLDSIREKFTHGDAELSAQFQANFTQIVRQVYDEETEHLELYQ